MTLRIRSKKLEDIFLSHRVLSRKVGKLPLAGRIVIGLSFALSFLLYGSLAYTIFKNDLKDDNVLELESCPACYGLSMCPSLKQGDVNFEGWSRLRFLDYVNVKNVHFGYQSNRKVVLKKLAHTSELEEFDSKICKMTGKNGGCNTADAMQDAFNKKSGYDWLLHYVQGISDMTRCPTQRLVDRILHEFKEKVDAVDLSAQEKMYLVTALMVNPEPIIFQTFPGSKGWPFPEYLGACGRFVIIENGGETLGNFYSAPWQKRVDLALQILQIAEQFTQNQLGFALYWTDLSYHNLAVNDNGRVSLIDGENILVVDTWQIKRDKEAGWEQPAYSVFDECEGGKGTCLSYSPDDLCQHHTADHNYYAACRNLLSSYASDDFKPGGLLHDLPEAVNEKYHLFQLLNRCAKPSRPGERLEVKDDLMKALKALMDQINAGAYNF